MNNNETRSQAEELLAAERAKTERWQSARAAMKMQTEEENAYEAAISRLQAASETNGNDFNLDRITNATTGPFKQVGRAR